MLRQIFISLLIVGAGTSFVVPLRAAVDQTAVTAALNSLVSLDTRTDASVVLNYQNMASKKSPDHDNAPNPLFTSVAPSALSSNTVKALNNLLSFYTAPDVDTPETITTAWNASISNFIDLAVASPVGDAAWKFLVQQGLSSSDSATYKNQLYQLWFSMYARNTVVGSSGFESVFSGELSGTNVLRFNNWIQFYNLEQAGKINYHGWFTKQNGIDISLQFTWGSAEDVQTNFLLNSSPEFEFAVYTVCALSGGMCSMTINGNDVSITAALLGKSIDQCYPGVSSGSGPANPTTKKPANNVDPVLQTLVNQMRAADVDRAAPGDIKLNWGNKVQGTQDTSPDPLFTSVNEAVFNRPVYQVLIDIYNNNLFVPNVCTAEAAITGFRKTALQKAIDTWTATQVFQLSFQYCQTKGVPQAKDINTFKTFLFNLWYGTYSRCSSTLGSSGWEHVFIGEWKSGEVDGQHSWVKYYLLEKAKQINYHGYDSYDGQLTGSFQYTWETELKKVGGFLIGTSPAFDFSLLTACALTHSGANACAFTLDGYPLTVTSYTQPCASGTCLSTAYPSN